MPFTPIYGWPYPAANAPPRHAADMRGLGLGIEGTVNGVQSDLAAAQAQLNALEAQALVVLDEVAETTPVSAVEFTNIPQTYQHLLVYWRGDGETGTNYSSLNARFNGDNSANGYTSQRINFASLSGTWTQELVTGGGPFFTVCRVGMVGSAAGSAGHFYIPFYSTPAWTKSVAGTSMALRSTGGDIVPTMAMAGGRWLSSSDAITSLWFTPGGNQWDRVRATLVGIRSGT